MKKLLSLLLLLALLLTGCAQAAPAATTTIKPETPKLQVHYLDVGQADCALLRLGDTDILIDGGNVDDGSYVVSYLQKQGVTELDLVVCSHAHEDHVGGLAAVLAVFPTKEIWSPTRTYSSKCFDDFVRYADQQRLEITIPQAGHTARWDGLSVSVLGPVEDYAETNNTSLVLRFVYGQTSFLFTGDMEKDAETDLLDSGAKVQSDVLKVGHHGSDTSSGYRFLYEVQPKYAVISVGKDNSYGHPHEEPLSRLRDAGVTLYRTDLLGAIVAESDGQTVTFSWEKSSAIPEDNTPVTHYVGNRNSHVLHLPTCTGLPEEKIRWFSPPMKKPWRQATPPAPGAWGELWYSFV
jgi:competence protein ComEC